ncbi:hypothetical protein ACOSP7_002525 [Xanthoceras sorbifolium]
MSLFQLPKSIIDDIHKYCARFWWGCVGDSNKIHWGSWSKLCKSIDYGGMRFRDLHIFNQTLLTKQAWRIISFSNSLASRVLKQCYFLTSTFLKAKKLSSGSFFIKESAVGEKYY